MKIVYAWVGINVLFFCYLYARGWVRAGRPPFIAWITGTYVP